MTNEGGAAFSWSADETRRLGYRVADLVADYLASLPDQPVFNPVPAAHAATFRDAPLPSKGEAADDVLDAFARDVAPYPFGNGHPRFFGWINSPPSPIGVFADALASMMNPSVAGGNHAAVHLEHQTVGWYRQMLGLPAESYGLFVSGASAAALVALTAARHAACARRGWDVRAAGVQGLPARLVIYKSAEGHGCNQKAAELLGIGRDHLRAVPCDAALRMRPDALEGMIAADVAAGHVPMAVVASAGTVNTGAIDPLDEIADVCARHGVWMHVDGAYGAPAVLLDEFRPALAALARADSLAVDPHKWMYAPVAAGLVFVREGPVLRDALSLVPPYLRGDGDEHGVQGPPWFSEYSVEQTRPFRALKVWMTLRHPGVEGYRALIAKDVALARRLADAVRADPDWVLWEPQGLGMVCFRAEPASLGGDAEALDAFNRAILTAVQLGGDAFLSSTVIGGRFWLRACVVNPNAGPADVDALFAAASAELRRALAASAASRP